MRPTVHTTAPLNIGSNSSRQARRIVGETRAGWPRRLAWAISVKIAKSVSRFCDVGCATFLFSALLRSRFTWAAGSTTPGPRARDLDGSA